MNSLSPSRVLAFLLCAAMLLWAQQNFSSPATILPSGNNTVAGELRLRDLTGHYVGLKAQTPIASSLTFGLPKVDGSSGNCLGWASALTLGWTSCGGSPTTLYDSNGKPVVTTLTTTTPVDYWTLGPDNSGDKTIRESPGGTDADINVSMAPKGAGLFKIQSADGSKYFTLGNNQRPGVVGGFQVGANNLTVTDAGFITGYGGQVTSGYGVAPIYSIISGSGLTSGTSQSFAASPAGLYRISLTLHCSTASSAAGTTGAVFATYFAADGTGTHAGGQFPGVGGDGSSNHTVSCANNSGLNPISADFSPVLIYSNGSGISITFTAAAPFSAGIGYYYYATLERLQ
jgi:hypothetical protein